MAEEKRSIRKVDIKNLGAIRWGNYTLFGLSESVPKQGITTTNMNHTERVSRQDITFDSDILGALAFYDHFKQYGKLLNDTAFFNKEKEHLMEQINDNPEKHVFFLPEINSSTKFDDRNNEKIIELQLAAESPIITCFITNAVKLNALKESISALREKVIVFFLDMNLTAEKFEKAYLLGLENSPFIGFVYRAENIHSKLNYSYIADRPDDQIVRIMTNITSKTRAKIEVCRSFNVWQYGFDYFMFATRIGPFTQGTIRAFDENTLQFISIENLAECSCDIDHGKKPIDVAKTYPNDIAYIPSAIHNILKINEVFDSYRKRLEKKEDISPDLMRKIELITTIDPDEFI